MATGRVASAVHSINSQLAHASAAAAAAPAPAVAVRAEDLPLWKTITTTTVDGGLSAVLKATRVHDPVVALLVSDDPPSDTFPQGGLGCELLEDLMSLSTEQREFEDLSRVLEACPSTKGRPAFLGRLRQAWAMAHSILTKKDERDTTPPPAIAAGPSEPANLEDPLGEAEKELMVNNWNSQHSFGFLPELTPAQGLLNRLGREWNPRGQWRMSLLQVRKVASVLHDNRPKTKQRLPLAGVGCASLHLEMIREDDMPVDDVMDYFWRLVTLFNAYAYAGAFQCTSTEATAHPVLMFNFEQAHSYPQKALMNCLAKAPPHQRLRWLENKDVLTRGAWLTLVNRQMPAGEALRIALDDHRMDWQSKDLSTLPGFDSRYVDGQDDDMGGAGNRQRRWQTAAPPRPAQPGGYRATVPFPEWRGEWPLPFLQPGLLPHAGQELPRWTAPVLEEGERQGLPRPASSMRHQEVQGP